MSIADLKFFRKEIILAVGLLILIAFSAVNWWDPVRDYFSDPVNRYYIMSILALFVFVASHIVIPWLKYKWENHRQRRALVAMMKQAVVQVLGNNNHYKHALLKRNIKGNKYIHAVKATYKAAKAAVEVVLKVAKTDEDNTPKQIRPQERIKDNKHYQAVKAAYISAKADKKYTVFINPGPPDPVITQVLHNDHLWLMKEDTIALFSDFAEKSTRADTAYRTITDPEYRGILANSKGKITGKNRDRYLKAAYGTVVEVIMWIKSARTLKAHLDAEYQL